MIARAVVYCILHIMMFFVSLAFSVYRYEAFGNGSEPFPAGNDGSLFVNPKYPININNGCPGNVELQDVWMPKPAWSVGGRFNADGSGGTQPNQYQDFG